MSTINTGSDPIEANVPVYWDLPHRDKVKDDMMNEATESECGQIKGHPQGIIYAATRAYKSEDLGDKLVEATMRFFETNDKDITVSYLNNDRLQKFSNQYGPPTEANLSGSANLCQNAMQRLENAKGLMQLKRRFMSAIEARNRIIGWSLNYAAPGEQLDLILKK